MVYLALDTTLDRDVAFALIKTDGLDETSRIRIQREAQAMGRLGSHVGGPRLVYFAWANLMRPAPT